MDNSKKSARIIYTVENKVTGEFYVGATTDSVEKRKQDHEQKAKNGSRQKFHEAISTYNADAFCWEQIDTANSIDELAIKEQYYVVEYNSKEEGYNSSIGGELKKTVYQYSLEDGSLIGQYNSLEEAGKVINCAKQHISRACLSVNKTYGSFYWSYEYNEPFKPIKDCRKKEVYQLSLKGYLLARYTSVSEASRQTGVSKTCISRVCRCEREKSGGFIWKYK